MMTEATISHPGVKFRETVANVESYKLQHHVGTSAACRALGLKVANYYSAKYKLKNQGRKTKKVRRAKVAALAATRKPAVVPIQAQGMAEATQDDRRMILVVGTPAQIGRIFREGLK